MPGVVRVHRSVPRGIAIPGALYLLVVVGFLVAAGVFAAVRLRRGTALRLLDAALAAAADDALAGALADWPAEARARLSVGDDDAVSFTSTSPVATRAVVRATRLSQTTFWLVADVRADAWPGIRRRVNLLVRVRPPPFAGAVALSSAGDVVLGAGATIAPDSAACEGRGAPPPGAAGDGAIALAPGARLIDDSLRARDSVRTTIVRADSLQPLAVPEDEWQALVRAAAVRFPAGVTTLATHQASAWAAGDLTLRGGQGSGVLLVEGRLTLAGPVAFTGLIVARGGIVTTADGANIEGLLVSLAGAAPTGAPAPVALTNVVALRASRCAVTRALVAAVRPVAVHGRAWAELF